MRSEPRASRHLGRMPLALAALVLCPSPAVAGVSPAAIARTDVTLPQPNGDGLFLPTDVAVGPGGTVWVADGVRDRVVALGAGGAWSVEVRAVGGLPLSRPVGLDVDARGRLWIADTGHGRVLVRAADGSLERALVPPEELGGRFDLTDVVVAPDGEAAWIVDNGAHRLLRWSLADDAVAVTGGRGSALGQFRHPFLAATAADGGVYVTDVLNGRVQAMDPDLRPRAVLGSYGVDLGELYRPKGLAVDNQGNVFVADGDLGVVQVFTRTGALVDVLRDPSGAPVRFEHPLGLDWAAGQLWVVEARPGRVRRLAVELSGGRRLPTRQAPLTPGRPRDCTSCHLELMPRLAQGLPTALIGVPPVLKDQPPASREEACLSCHDGSVEDSRRPVWVEHGHRTGVAPPPGMEVPEVIPLVGGRLACRSCHTAHSEGGSGRTCREALFLRVGQEPTELCLACHGDMNAARSPLPEPRVPPDGPSGHLDAAP